ncbi:MAG: dipeptidase [Thermoleophilaceae bacterium]|jgi:peptidase E|nr:dipeptidase [Thermoleophilaceae bacterium]
MTERRRIIAMGGGGFSCRPGDPELDRYVIEQADVPCPSICLLPTASGDPDDQIQRFYRAFHELPCTPSHLSLFRLGGGPIDIATRLLGNDIIYVGGGSLSNLLAIWRVHKLDEILREAWEQGVVLCGISAGSMCWFRGGVTKSHGEPRVAKGLGLLPYSNSVHWTSEPERRIVYRKAVADGVLPPGFGVDDGTALLFAGNELVDVVRTQGSAGAFRVGLRGEEGVEAGELEPPPIDADLVSIEEFRAAKRLHHG